MIGLQELITLGRSIMKLFIKRSLCSLLLIGAYDTLCLQKKTDTVIRTIPLYIKNKGTKEVDLQLDLRIDYYYSHKGRTTFLPASAINKRIAVPAQGIQKASIPLPPQPHEPHNTIKRKLREKGYEQTGTIIRGVIGHAKEPKKFYRIKDVSLQGQNSYTFTINVN